jgi:glycosyltransferase involved in cell wall biosynthesis
VSIRVSVVVAVYNPGPSFDELVASLLRQTLAAEEFEVWFCDDGSEPETIAQLERLTAEHPHLKVMLLPHSGWPGTPRNAGLDAAAGTYVFFADHDDYFGDDALRTMVDHADEWGSDVLVPRLTRVGRRPSMRMFRRNVPDARLGEDPLLEYLTPHKLFRTTLLREHGIRFPDGRVRLEDHLLVTRAYFAARVISILADYPCYYWTVRTDRPSASVGRLDPTSYFGYLGQVLDIVEGGTEPGELRDRLLAHWYAGKVLDRVGTHFMVNYPDDYRAHLLDVLEPFVAERFDPRLDQYLPFPKRVRSALLRAGRRDDLVRLAEVDQQIVCRARATEVAWGAGGRLQVTAEAEVQLRDGTPLRFVPGADGALRWEPPVDLPADVVTPEVLDASRDVAADQMVVLLRDRKDSTDCWLPDDAHERLPGAPLRVRALLDPKTARLGRPIPRRSELGVDGTRAGWPFTIMLRVSDEVLAQAGPPKRVGSRVFTLSRGRQGPLSITGVRVPKPKTPPPPPPPPPTPGWKRVARGVRRRLRRLQGSGSKG